jgi:Flp pilus assembly protein TadG
MRRFPTHAPRRPAPRRGVSAVEFALVAPLLVTLILGMIELARGFQVKEVLSDATQQACRTASQPGKGNSDVQAQVDNIMADNKITGYSVTILVNGVASDVATATRNDQVSVKVAVPASQVYWVSTLFLKAQMIESETVVMLRQG